MPLTRRAFIKSANLLLAGFGIRSVLSCHGEGLPAEEKVPKIPVPTPAQVEWQSCEIGVIFHLDMPVLAGDPTRNNATRKTFDPKLYNPRDLDTDQWIAAAKSAGARYAVFTATHFNGFMQWQSDLYPYGCKQAAWRNGTGDVVADFVASCHKFDIKPALYLSTHRNVYHTVWGHYVDWGNGRGTEQQQAFNRIAEKMTEELCSRYGRLLHIWYDAGVKTPEEGGPDVLPVFERYQPDSVFYHSTQRSDFRWIGNEAGHAGYPCWSTMPGLEVGPISHNSDSWKKCLYNGEPSGSYWSPGMVDIVLRGKGNHAWFWHPGEDHTIHTVDELMDMYLTSVGRNCNLVIGAVIDPNGLVPEGDARRLGEFGAELERRFSNPVAQTSGEGEELTLTLPQPRTLDQISIMEDIVHGERIREYIIDGLQPGPDGEWARLCSGQSVGHKRIDTIPPTTLQAIRFKATSARALPMIKELAVFGTS
jgi:alpha-L-fucosidase